MSPILGDGVRDAAGGGGRARGGQPLDDDALDHVAALQRLRVVVDDQVGELRQIESLAHLSERQSFSVNTPVSAARVSR
jgi:hypothetical protein